MSSKWPEFNGLDPLVMLARLALRGDDGNESKTETHAAATEEASTV